MKTINYFGRITLLVFAMLFTVSCGSDDDDDISIDNNLIGKWHTFKAVVSAQNQSVDLDITKTGTYSQLYFEAVFNTNNKVDMSYYEVDANNASRWETETENYSVKGDVITVYDETGAIDLFYNPKDGTMYMRMAAEVDNIGYTTVFLYFRK